MNYDQFFKEMIAIEAVVNVEVTIERPRQSCFFGRNVITFIGRGANNEEINVCIKHHDRSTAFETAVNLANLLSAAPVL